MIKGKLKTGIKYIRKVLLCFVVLIVGYLLMAIILSIISTNPENLDCTEEKEVFISTNGIHLDIIIPRKLITKRLQQELQLLESIEYISFGWGDKEFYLETPTWNDLKISTAFKAVFLNSESAIHLTYYFKKYGHWKKIRICKIQLELLVHYLDKSFKRVEGKRLVEIQQSGYMKYDKFYDATGNFSCIQTCNNWVNKGLKEAKIKTSIWSPFDYGVLYHIKRNDKKIKRK